MKNIIEKNCIIEHNGIKFENSGSMILGDKIICYAYEKEKKCGNWHGTEKVNCYFGKEYRSNFGDKRQSVYFRYMGVDYYGVYFKENSDIIRARKIKK